MQSYNFMLPMLPFVTSACEVSSFLHFHNAVKMQDELLLLPTIHIDPYTHRHQQDYMVLMPNSLPAPIMTNYQCRFRSALEMRAAMRDFARAARDYSRRYSAAIKMQSLARGFLARRAFAHLVAAHQRRLRLEQADRAAALAVIAPWAATFAARSHFLRLRCVH